MTAWVMAAMLGVAAAGGVGWIAVVDRRGQRMIVQLRASSLRPPLRDMCAEAAREGARAAIERAPGGGAETG